MTLIEQAGSSLLSLLADAVILFAVIGLYFWADDLRKSDTEARKSRVFFIAAGLCAASALSSGLLSGLQPDLWAFFRVILAICGICKAIGALVLLIHACNLVPVGKKQESQPTGIPKIPSYEIPEYARHVDNRFIQVVSEDFAALGWNKWNSKVHHLLEQYKRILRGNDPEACYYIYWYSPASGHAKISGSHGNMYLVSGSGCSCRDFHERGLPCKHMYFLASQLVRPEFQNINQTDNPFYKFTFAIAGGSQAKIKAYIKQYQGTVTDQVTADTTALILNTDKDTQKISNARYMHVELMTFDDLQALQKTIKRM